MFAVDETVKMCIDVEKRLASGKNHSSTHLLQKALREVLGTHVEQHGSDVNPERLRFDFSHFSAMTTEEIAKVEKIVNEKIQEGLSGCYRDNGYRRCQKDRSNGTVWREVR